MRVQSYNMDMCARALACICQNTFVHVHLDTKFFELCVYQTHSAIFIIRS
jgi:hypothetical protein